MVFERYTYTLPEELIAKSPAMPRDSSRLFAYDCETDLVTLATFRDIARFLPKPCLLILNETKVVPARVWLYKIGGGKVQVLFLVNEWRGSTTSIKVMVDRKVSVGDKLSFGYPDGDSVFDVVGQEENIFELKPLFESSRLLALLDKHGSMPLPKYIKCSPLGESELRQRYQTIFAQDPASVAAPTASLHFTPEVFRSLEDAGIRIARVSLHVGLGTFAPVNEKNEKTGKLHMERYVVPVETADAIRQAKSAGVTVVAVGTTVVRTLEAAADRIFSEEKGVIRGETDIFIRPPYAFRVVDALVTNFHIPGSSLMMLGQAFIEYKGSKRELKDLYERAILENFRFYSFGDSMFIS